MPETTADIKPHELNPRKITPEQLARLQKSLKAYGDISGVVYNRRTRKQVAGHQRISGIGACAIECKYLDKPDNQGTIGAGYIITPDGVKLAYREVDWPKEIEYAAMIAANTHAGDWDEALLRQTLVLISEDANQTVDPQTIGLEQDFVEKLFKNDPLELNVQEQEKKALDTPMTAKEIEQLPAQVALVQLFLTVATRPRFIELCKKLQIKLGTGNITDTIYRCVEDFAHDNRITAQSIGLPKKATGNNECECISSV